MPEEFDPDLLVEHEPHESFVFGYDFQYDVAVHGCAKENTESTKGIGFSTTVNVKNLLNRTIFLHNRSGYVCEVAPERPAGGGAIGENLYIYVTVSGPAANIATLVTHHRMRNAIGILGGPETAFIEEEHEAANLINSRAGGNRYIRFCYTITSKDLNEFGGTMYHAASDFLFSDSPDTVTAHAHPATVQSALTNYSRTNINARLGVDNGFYFNILYIRPTRGRKKLWFVYNNEVRRLDATVNDTIAPGFYVMETPPARSVNDKQKIACQYYATAKDLPIHLQMYENEPAAQAALHDSEETKAQMRLQAMAMEREKQEKTHQEFLEKFDLRLKEIREEAAASKEADRLRGEQEKLKMEREEARWQREEHANLLKNKLEAEANKRKDTSDILRYVIFLATNVLTVAFMVLKSMPK